MGVIRYNRRWVNRKRSQLEKKERKTDSERSIQIKFVESGQDCDKYKVSCNVDMDGDTANLNVQVLSYAGLKLTT
jgi:hypothetical protein